jgi:two-component system NtrC family sensor kinase
VAGETILVIDDNAPSREFVVEAVLKPNGYAPLEADSFEAGALVVAERSPDLVILAMQTPGFAPGFLDRLRAHGHPIPTILTTMRRDQELAPQVGVRDILYKPFEPGTAAHVIERVLGEARLRRERDELSEKLAQTRRQMDRQMQELNALYTVGKTVSATLDLEQVLAQVVEAATYMTRAEEGSLLLLDESTGELYLRAAKNLDQRVARDLHGVRVSDSLLGRVVKHGRPLMLAAQDLVKLKTHYLVKALLYVPLKVPPDHIIGVLGVANKISEQVFSEHDVFLLSALGDYAAIAIQNARLFAAVETERSELEAVLRGTEDVVIVLDQDKSVVLCNPAARKAFNIETPSLTGRPLAEVAHSQALLDLFQHPPAIDRPARAEIQLADGRTLQAQVSAIEGIGYAAVMQDITHLKELDRIKSEFVSVVSHDLRSPLTTISGYVELLPRVGPLTPQQAEFVNRVGQSMKTITDLIGDLLDIGRIEAGLDQESAPCRMEDIVLRSLDSVRMAAEEKHHSLSEDIASGLPLVTGNARRLEQVVTNLLTNAIKYTPDGGKIDLSLGTEGRYLMLRVKDNGIGIPLEDQPHVFDKFYRVLSEATVEISGTGLGLSIVKSVVQKHGGRVWVESEPGQGSTFSVLLPTKR